MYKASYAYFTIPEKMFQGYNGFAYRKINASNGAWADMSVDSSTGKWSGESSYMIGSQMTSTNLEYAQRVFCAMRLGNVVVSGNPRLVSGNSAVVTVSISDLTDSTNETVVCEYTLTDKEGIYHNNTINITNGSDGFYKCIKFTAKGNATVEWNPTINYNTNSAEELLHRAADGWLGDVHPFYHDGKLYIYYLSTGNETQSTHALYDSLLFQSDDFIHFNNKPIAIDNNNKPDTTTYFVLGTYTDSKGVFRSCFGNGQTISSSKSTDLYTWGSGSEYYFDKDGNMGYKNRIYLDSQVKSFRDPAMYYDPFSEKTYCVILSYYSTLREKGEKGLALYKGDKEGVYENNFTKLIDFTDSTGANDAECPQIIRIGSRWYLFYSRYGTGTAGNVGRLSYRIGDVNTAPDKVNWKNKPEYTLDGGDLHAAQICEVGDKYYMFGWVNYLANQNVWGGYLNLAREVFQKPDGTLGSRIDECFYSLLNHGKICDISANNTSGNLSVSGGTFISNGNGSSTVNGSYGRSIIEGSFSLKGNGAFAGFSAKQGGTTYYAGVVRVN
ncbi:MAG: hypothetical protein J5662_01700, partial [Clostridia bacterium]|nr:hypothetical protein [Clostridia bacterium]